MFKYLFGIVVIFYLINANHTIAQDKWEHYASTADSLRKAGKYKASLPLYRYVLKHIPVSQTDEQLKYQIRIGLSYFMLGQNKSACSHFNTVLARTEHDPFSIFRGHALNNLGLVYENTGEFTKSVTYYERANTVYRSIEDDYLSDITIMNIGKVRQKQGNYTEALKYLTTSARAFEKRGDSLQLGEIYSTLGLIQESLGDNTKAKELHLRSIAIRTAIHDTYGLASAYNNIGWVFKESGQLDSARYYYLLSIELMNRTSHRNIGHVYHNLGFVYEQLGNWGKAEYYLNRAVRHKKELSDSNEIVISLNGLAHIMTVQGKLKKSLGILQSGNRYLNKATSKETVKDLYTEWKDYYTKAKIPDSALFYFEQASNLERELFQEKYIKELALLQESFEAESREHTITTLDSENSTQKNTIQSAQKSISQLTWIVFGALGIIIILFLALAFMRERNKNKIVESRLQGGEDEKKRVSMELHDASGSNLRHLVHELLHLMNASKGEIHNQLEKLLKHTESTMQEIIMISHTLHHPRIETSLFSLMLEDYIYDWLENKSYMFTANTDDFTILDVFTNEAKSHMYRFIQETLINIDRHSTATEIKLSIETKNDLVSLSLTDNGIGTTGNEKQGIGHVNMQERARLMSGTFTFKNTPNGSMSTLIISISLNRAKG